MDLVVVYSLLFNGKMRQDAMEHMRKEEFNEIFNKSTHDTDRIERGSVNENPRKEYARMTKTSYYRQPTDYYEYYPSFMRSYLPSRRIGNMMTIYESNGLLMVTAGPHWPGVVVVVFMLLGGARMNYTQVKNSAAMQAIVYIFLSFSLLFLFLTACTDPGIIRISQIQVDEEQADGLSFCDICSIHRPHTAIHCMDCNCCIDEMDHHCPWMGKCIGKKNMKWFILFNLTWMVFLVEFLFVMFTAV